MEKKYIIAVLLLAIGLFSYHAYEQTRPLKIGVILPLQGPLHNGLEKVLEWGVETVNANGGIDGRRLELDYTDHYDIYKYRNGTNEEEWLDMYRDFVVDMIASKDTKVYIGFGGLNADLYIEKRRIVISPYETPSSMFRMYGKKEYYWRTCIGDVAQARTIVHILAERNASSVALIYPDDSYGDTFYEWTGFFATEAGIEVTLVQQQPYGDVAGPVRQALEGNPDYLIVAVTLEDVPRLVQEFNRLNSTSKLFFTDEAARPYIIDQLGPAAEGLEGLSATYDPDSGFAEAYTERFGRVPEDYAAQMYDAFLLAAYTVARQERTLLEGHAASLKAVVNGRGEPVAWNEVNLGISSILDGRLPDISGAGSGLDFDSEYGVEPLNSYYSHWRVEDGEFRTVDIIPTEESADITRGEAGAAISRSRATDRHAHLSRSSEATLLPPKEDTWAVIVASSSGWPEYRHQADALAVYDLLKSKGMPDDRIILMAYDDVPWLAENPLPGDIHNVPGGANLRAGAEIDYKGEQVTVETLSSVLLGEKSESTPTALLSDEGSNVFLYLVDHGMPGKVLFPHEQLGAQQLTEIVDSMHAGKKYRRLLIMVDACFGESMALNLSTPEALYLTGASKQEPSYGRTYDRAIKQWLSDEFTAKTLATIEADPEISIMDLYQGVFRQVVGSHVRLVNYENFGGLDSPISEFISP